MVRTFLVCSLVMAGQAVASDVAFIKVPGVFDYNTPEAPYNKLLKELQSSMTVEGRFLPSARANKLLINKKFECIFPILPPKSRDFPTILSEPINGLKAYAFTLAGKPKVSGLSDLRGKTVVYLRGYLFGGLLEQNPDIHFFPVSDQEAALGVLKKGRADAYLDYIPDLRLALSEEGYGLLKYDIKKPIIEDHDRIECIDNPNTRKFIDDINERLSALKASGKLQELLGKYFVATD
ncbi:MAG: transporter substrate-binding domain-containing protein [Gammaproteobacteria bacterium]|nr:transporter substrate-binding domain-containing protein [Gammaproteobacteria bacterium]